MRERDPKTGRFVPKYDRGLKRFLVQAQAESSRQHEVDAVVREGIRRTAVQGLIIPGDPYLLIHPKEWPVLRRHISAAWCDAGVPQA
jgi:hypothetical protein